MSGLSGLNGRADVWKWIAAFFAGIVLAGTPAAAVSLTAPSRSDLERLRSDVVQSQLQAARIEERIAAQIRDNQTSLEALREQIAELRARLNDTDNG